MGSYFSISSNWLRFGHRKKSKLFFEMELPKSRRCILEIESLNLRLIESFGHCRSEKMWSQKQRKIKNICERPKT